MRLTIHKDTPPDLWEIAARVAYRMVAAGKRQHYTKAEWADGREAYFEVVVMPGGTAKVHGKWGNTDNSNDH